MHVHVLSVTAFATDRADAIACDKHEIFSEGDRSAMSPSGETLDGVSVIKSNRNGLLRRALLLGRRSIPFLIRESMA